MKEFAISSFGHFLRLVIVSYSERKVGPQNRSSKVFSNPWVALKIDGAVFGDSSCNNDGIEITRTLMIPKLKMMPGGEKHLLLLDDLRLSCVPSCFHST